MINIKNLSKHMKDSDLAAAWKRFDMKAAEKTLARLQRDVALAALSKKPADIKLAQTRLVNSLEARILAVKHVSDRTHSPGIDGVLWHTNAERLRAALSLNSDKYVAKPTKLFVINTPGKKQRHIQLPTVFDRAMQILYAFALDPVSEATADRKSFAARRGRSMGDLHVYLTRTLNPNQPGGPPLYIIKTDVKMCYGSISHDWLRKNIPINTYVLDQFLTAGHIFQGEFFPSEDDSGIPIGASISPILANMTLDGAQHAIYCGLRGRDLNFDYRRDKNFDYTDGELIRFADDMIISVRTYENVHKVLEILDKFLKERGLKLSADKTKYIDLNFDGFDFLARHYRCHSNWVESTPSDEAVAKFENSLRDFIRSYQGSQRSLIEKLNQRLNGWATYHKITDATSAFRRIDTTVSALLLELCERLHPNTPRQKLIDKFFYEPSTGERTYALVNKPNIRVIQLYHQVKLAQHPVIPLKMNPYLDDYYFENKDKDKEVANMTGRYKKVWARQGERCYYCGKPILVDEKKFIVSINPEQPLSARNAAYIHANCSNGQVEFIHNDYDFINRFDLYDFLEQMLAGKPAQTHKKSKYYPLTLYFQRQDKDTITLKFSEIEEIIGKKLCTSAYLTTNFWSHENTSSCWRQNGYRLKSLHLKDRSISFIRIEDLKSEALDLPPFLFKRLPKNACTEIKTFLEYIKSRYGL